MSDRTALIVRILWIVSFLFALGAVIVATNYAVNEKQRIRASFERFGLYHDATYEGPVDVSLFTPGIDKPPLGRIVAIDGRPVSPEALAAELAGRLDQVRGDRVRLNLRYRTGERATIERGSEHRLQMAGADPDRGTRLAIRLSFALLACASTLLCSLLLALRRPHDPVAMIFALTFTMMAASIDPPLPMWMGLGLSEIVDITAALWFMSLIIALVTFPDGLFVPRAYRWLLVLVLPLAILVSWPSLNELFQSAVACGVLLATLVGQVRRFRRLPPGIERQQMKYAGFGFATGLVLVCAALVLVVFLPEDNSRFATYAALGVVSLFSLGMAAFPLGLLVALLRFRLWEADKVISRSAGYALVTLVVGVVWAATADIAKVLVASVMGSNHEAAGTLLSAVVAAGVFSPTQSVVLGWTKRRFAGPGARLAKMRERFKEWQLTVPPADLGSRALAGIEDAVHPAYAAIFVEADGTRQQIATLGADDPDLPAATTPDIRLRLPLADDDGRVGELWLGKRSDGNRYNKEEIESLREFARPLASALRASWRLHFRENMMQRTIEQMQARIAQLEGGPRPSLA